MVLCIQAAIIQAQIQINISNLFEWRHFPFLIICVCIQTTGHHHIAVRWIAEIKIFTFIIRGFQNGMHTHKKRRFIYLCWTEAHDSSLRRTPVSVNVKNCDRVTFGRWHVYKPKLYGFSLSCCKSSRQRFCSLAANLKFKCYSVNYVFIILVIGLIDRIIDLVIWYEPAIKLSIFGWNEFLRINITQIPGKRFTFQFISQYTTMCNVTNVRMIL